MTLTIEKIINKKIKIVIVKLMNIKNYFDAHNP